MGRARERAEMGVVAVVEHLAVVAAAHREELALGAGGDQQRAVGGALRGPRCRSRRARRRPRPCRRAGCDTPCPTASCRRTRCRRDRPTARTSRAPAPRTAWSTWPARSTLSTRPALPVPTTQPSGCRGQRRAGRAPGAPPGDRRGRRAGARPRGSTPIPSSVPARNALADWARKVFTSAAATIPGARTERTKAQRSRIIRRAQGPPGPGPAAAATSRPPRSARPAGWRAPPPEASALSSAGSPRPPPAARAAAPRGRCARRPRSALSSASLSCCATARRSGSALPEAAAPHSERIEPGRRGITRPATASPRPP